MKRLAQAAAVLLLAASAAVAQDAPDAWLRAEASADREAVPRGGRFRVTVVADIDEGFHVNAHDAGTDAVPTALAPGPHDGIAWDPVRYPTAEPLAVEWLEGKALPVYGGRAVFTVDGIVAADAPLGPATLTLALRYQGCNETTCFQPTTRRLEAAVRIVENGAAPAEIAPRFDAPPEAASRIRFEGETDVAALFEESLLTYLGVLFLGGLLLNGTPCVFPLIPVTMNVFAQQGESRPAKVLPLAALYALGIAAMFTLVGVLSAVAGSSLGAVLQSPWGVLAVVTVLAVLMASTFGAFEIRLPSGVMGKLGGRRGALGAAFMGMVMGAIAAPCVGPFLLALIMFIAARAAGGGRAGAVALGAVSFFVVGLGLGTPYVVLGTFTGLVNRFPRSGGWLVWFKRLLGMTLAGLILYFVQPYVQAAFFWPLVLGLFLFAAVYLGFVEGLSRRPFSRRFRAVRILTAAALVAAGCGVYTWGTSEGPAVAWEPWREGALASARAEGRPVLLYFGAEWCVACKEWKALVFADPEVVEASKACDRLYVDVTEPPERAKRDLAERFQAVNPPVVAILGADGGVRKAWRDPPAPAAFAETLRQAAGAER